MLRWDDVRYLVTLEREGSLAAAARALDVDQTTVSRRLRALERALGTPLFERVDGRWTTTSAGRAAVALGHRVEEGVIALGHAVRDGAARIEGTVRITAIDVVLWGWLAARLPGLRQRHPDLALELVGGHVNLSLARREADVALRMSRPASGPNVIRKLADCGFAVYGARGATAPAWPGGQADWVAYDTTLAALPEMRWLAAQAQSGRVVARASGTAALLELVAAGVGIGVLPCFVGEARADLVRLSGAQPVLARELWLVIHEDLRGVPRIRAVADWLVERFVLEQATFVGVLP